MGLNFKEWLEVYKYCTEKNYSFMFINFQKDKGERIMKNFTEVVGYNRDPIVDVVKRKSKFDAETNYENRVKKQKV